MPPTEKPPKAKPKPGAPGSPSRNPRYKVDICWERSIVRNMRHNSTIALFFAVAGSIAASAHAGQEVALLPRCLFAFVPSAHAGQEVALLPRCLLAFVPSANAADKPVSLHTKLAWQIALERVGFSPGIIDGSIGRKTEIATREFQRVRGLPITGKLDAATAAALGVDAGRAVKNYTVRTEDLAQIGTVPRGWLEKSRLPGLGYENLSSVLAERFHCTIGLIARLNPGRDLNRLQAGALIVVPAVDDNPNAPRGDQMEIDLSEKIVRVLDRQRKLVGLFHCSIAKDRKNLPSGEASVVVITENPTYTFDPEMWPEVKDVDRKLLIPAGPRNPVGRCWIGLSLPGYGIHGSPNPELIGKTGSHGCFRLTNWDALRLAAMIRVGIKVRFV